MPGIVSERIMKMYHRYEVKIYKQILTDIKDYEPQYLLSEFTTAASSAAAENYVRHNDKKRKIRQPYDFDNGSKEVVFLYEAIQLDPVIKKDKKEPTPEYEQLSVFDFDFSNDDENKDKGN